MPHRIQALKPRLKKSGSAIEAAGVKPALSYDSGSDIIMFKEESWSAIVISWVKTLFLFALSAAFIGFVLYLILAGTVLFASSVGGKTAFVARGTFLGGMPSTGETILVSRDVPSADDAVSKIKDGTLGVGNAAIVKVVAPQDAVVEVNAEGILADGTQYSGSLSGLTPGSLRLSDQVAVQCLAGSCTAGELFTVPTNFVYGEVRNPGEFG